MIGRCWIAFVLDRSVIWLVKVPMWQLAGILNSSGVPLPACESLSTGRMI